jgi:hypothetical protein
MPSLGVKSIRKNGVLLGIFDSVRRIIPHAVAQKRQRRLYENVVDRFRNAGELGRDGQE